MLLELFFKPNLFYTIIFMIVLVELFLRMSSVKVKYNSSNKSRYQCDTLGLESFISIYQLTTEKQTKWSINNSKLKA